MDIAPAPAASESAPEVKPVDAAEVKPVEATEVKPVEVQEVKPAAVPTEKPTDVAVAPVAANVNSNKVEVNGASQVSFNYYIKITMIWIII